MTMLAVLLGAVMVWLDAGPGKGFLDGIGWYQSAKPEGAHQVLSTIAGSMITVAGVVFSITIVALAYAAGQYGPRVLTNFMSDRGNQVTLGTFIGTFAYCLVVLRTIRGGESEFVPQMAVMTGLFLALCSIGVLIYFIHHVPQSIHVNNVIANIGEHLIRSVGMRYPKFIGASPDESEPDDGQTVESWLAGQSDGLARATAMVEARCSGYIQAIDEDRLIKSAQSVDGVARLLRRPGDYVHSGRPLLELHAAAGESDYAHKAFRDSYIVGALRTPSGDLGFLVDELVEIAARALSSGVNDPYTAISCVDWLGAGATELSRRELPSSRRLDSAGKLRVIALPDTFEDFIERGFGRLRQYAARDMNAAVHVLNTLGEVASGCRSPTRVAVVCAEARRLAELAEVSLDGPPLETIRRHWGNLGAWCRSEGRVTPE